MKQYSKERLEISLISKSYINNKRIIRESEENIIRRNYEDLRVCHRIVDHIESVANTLDEKERLIIENEVMNGQSGKWYTSYFSAPTYYRQRRKAYKSFLRCLEK